MNRKQTERYGWIVLELSKYGLDLREIDTLVRAERTLGRWGVAECNGEIQRDEATGKPVNGYTRTAIPDRETATLARIDKIVKAHKLEYYHQGDPRGCALYIIRPGDIANGQKVDCCYNRGLAICID